MKPKLMYYSDIQMWLCLGMGVTTLGLTKEAAYFSWKGYCVHIKGASNGRN